MTTYEVNEYNKLKKYIKDFSDISGKLYYVIIMLSKCDKNLNSVKKDKIKNNNEIEDSDEDTNINDLIIKVKNKFPEEDIILYNAYGRSCHNEKTSSTLKKFIEKMIDVPTKFNILFDISKYILNFSDKQEKLYFDKFIIRYNSIIIINSDYDDIVFLFWMKITNNEQLNHLMKIRNDKFDNNYNIFKFINLVIENNQEYLKIINLKLIDYYKDILINNDYIDTVDNYYRRLNHYKDYTQDDINKLFINIFKQSSLLDQTEIYTKLFQDDFDYDKTYLIISSIHSEGYNKEDFKFTNIFNCYIKTLKYGSDYGRSFCHFYSKILLIINKIPIYINNDYIEHNYIEHTIEAHILLIEKKYDYNISYDKTLTLSEKFNIFLNYLNKLNEDNDYILLNKLQIINVLFSDGNTILKISKYKISFNIHSKPNFIEGNGSILDRFKPNFIENNDSILNRFKHNDTYLNIVNQIWTKIYSNIQIPYNGFIGNFIPLDLTELLYT